MKFSKSKFIKLSQQRKVNKLLQFINEIEINWNNESMRNDLIDEFEKCLKLMDEDFFYQIANNLKRDNLRLFLRSIMPIEQNFSINKRDYDLNIIIKKDGIREASKQPIYLILDELRSAFNIGSIFRSAECFGIKEILLTGYTASPDNAKVEKTSMGTANLVKWQKLETTQKAIDYLRAKKVTIYAMETVAGAKSIESVNLQFPCAFILGNEALGISEQTLALADEILQIPLSGWKNSLNVGVTAAICCYEASKQHKS
ncbi:MAG: RNA methyltransferase [Candidatus Cloacimonetes bacterium]|nr:RNA methyltransferase [Candidatus Cloacimonadota bacterium]